MKRLPILAVAAIALVGCTARRERSTDYPQSSHHGTTLSQVEAEYVALITLDLSPSFRDKIIGDGAAWKFATRVADTYFRDRIGSADKLVIASLSGTSRSIIWEGQPLELRKKFTADSFREYLVSKADTETGNDHAKVYDGLRHALNYVMEDPRVSEGNSRIAVFVLSSMIDADPVGREAETRLGYLNHELAKVGWRGGAVGLYFVDQELVREWQFRMTQLGIKRSRVEGWNRDNPPLPTFE